MKRVALAVILLVTLACLAQFSYNDQPFLANSVGHPLSFSPPQASGLGFWWVAEDNPQSKVTNWVDRVQGSVWKNDDAAFQPTNTASGVQFWRNATTFLTNTVNISASQNSSHFLIFKLNRNTVLQNFLDISPSVFTRSIGVDSSGPGTLHIRVSPNQRNNGLLASNTWYSVLITCAVGPQTIFYTNGIASNTNVAGNLGSATWGCFGGVSGSGFLDAYVRELAIWTNTVLTGTDASNLHLYATQKYGL